MVRLLFVFVTACGRLGFDETGSTDAATPEPGLLVVTSPADPASDTGLTLRAALGLAQADPQPNRITFDPSILPASIEVGSTLVVDSNGTTIDATGVSVTVSTVAGFTGDVIDVTADEVTLDNLVITGSSAAIVSTDTASLLVRGGTIAQTTGDGVRLTQVSKASVEGVRFDKVGGDPVAVRNSTEVRIERVFIVLTAKTGDVAGVRVENSSTVRILDNIIDPGPARLVTLLDSSDNEITGNILDRGDVGVILIGTSSRNLVLRNVIIEAATDSVLVEGDKNIVVNNTFFNTTNVVDAGTNTITGNNFDSTSAADFVNAPAYDFHLVVGCPAINAGNDLGYDLLPALPERFLGSAPDLGGVESF